MESLKKLREPAAIVALIVLTVRILLVPATAVIYAQSDIIGVTGLLSYRAADPLVVLVLTGLVASCILDGPTPHARTLAAAALVVIGVAVLVGVLAALAGLAEGSAVAAMNTLDQLGYLAMPVLAIIALVRLRSLAPAGMSAAAYGVGAGQPQQGRTAEPSAPQPDEQYQPSWLPDAAAGAAWQRAGDAAAGAPASGWGTPGLSGGWQAEPGHPPAAGPPPAAGSGWSSEPPAPGWNPPRT